MAGAPRELGGLDRTLTAVPARFPPFMVHVNTGELVRINRAFRILSAVALAALAALIGVSQGDVTSRHVEATDTTWLVPVDVAPQDTTWAAPADVAPQGTTWAVPAGTVEAQPADTTW
ncbi:hypothetical protein [Streptomyces sp. NPDC002573]|uniref:hypothetical protein n=1 Tax=Streptomyces sp. NPDC002573 TaxID=3364651 RepID=UPI0036A4B07B